MEIQDLRINDKISRGTLTEVHIADLHFGVFDPLKQYQILKDQYLNKIKDLQFQIMSIDGDIFDHKFMSNADSVLYATLFADECVQLCREKSATLIIIGGTKSHDYEQLKLFYHYLQDNTVHIEIVESIRFVYTHGAKILCIPEMYNMGSEYYNQFLLYSGEYDTVFMHGMFKGAVSGMDTSIGLDAVKAPTFDMNDFAMCRGPIISGHVHKPGCFKTHFYYCGNPYRWCFGEEEEKGFVIVLHDLDTRMYYYHFEPIQSYQYITINLDSMLKDDPRHIIEYVERMQANGIDNVRIEFLMNPTEDELGHLNIIKNYYRTNPTVKIKAEPCVTAIDSYSNPELAKEMNEYSYIMDRNLSEYEILTRYINQQKGYEYITTQELIDILKACD